MVRVVGAVCALALTVAACGSGGSSPERAYAEAIASQLRADLELPFTDGEIRCMADGIVAELGVDGLEARGLTLEAIRAGTGPDDVGISTDDAARIAGVYLGCADVAAALVKALVDRAGIGAEAAGCIRDRLTEDLMREVLTAATAGGDPPARFSEAIAACQPG